MEEAPSATGATGPDAGPVVSTEPTRAARSATQRITRTIHAQAVPLFGELARLAPDLRIATEEGEEATQAIGFRDPDGEAHLYAVNAAVRLKLVLAILPTLSEEQKSVFLEGLTGLVIATADVLPPPPG